MITQVFFSTAVQGTQLDSSNLGQLVAEVRAEDEIEYQNEHGQRHRNESQAGMANTIQSRNEISTPVNSLKKGRRATMQRPPPTRVPMPPHEQAKGKESIMKLGRPGLRF